MKSIEDRAKEYAERICEVISYEDFNHVSQDFANGARSEHELLTKWNNPIDYPDTERQVLAKLKDNSYIVVNCLDGFYKVLGDPVPYNDIIIGWREIYE